MGITTNANGQTIVYFAQPPNPNFPQSTELIDRLINSEFTTKIISQSGEGHWVSAINWNEWDGNTNWPEVPRNWTDATRISETQNNTGTGALISFDPEANPWILTTNRFGNRVRPARRPNFIGLAHELIHADRYRRGAMIDFRERYDFDFREQFLLFFRIRRSRNSMKDEIATVGLAFNTDCDITENDIRSEHGLRLRGVAD